MGQKFLCIIMVKVHWSFLDIDIVYRGFKVEFMRIKWVRERESVFLLEWKFCVFSIEKLYHLKLKILKK